ncbi:MAG: hypothetical protein KDC67_11385, partial [Ignavibacteriae bacterium]|nr:hypothetical protein [Ignavibacteriota bacterium]
KHNFKFKNEGFLKYIYGIGNCNFHIIEEPKFVLNIIALRHIKDWLNFKFSQIIEYPRGQIIGDYRPHFLISIYFKMPIKDLFLNKDVLDGFLDTEACDYTYSKRISTEFSAYINKKKLYINCKYGYYQGDNARDGNASLSIEISALLKLIDINLMASQKSNFIKNYTPFNENIFETTEYKKTLIEKAISKKEKIEFRYTNLDNTKTFVTIKPTLISIDYDGLLSVFGYSHLKENIISYTLLRISEIN